MGSLPENSGKVDWADLGVANAKGHKPSRQEPIALTPFLEVPPFPVDSLPKPIADMVYELSVATQRDPAMAGTSALSALSACVGGHAVIEVHDGWKEQLCLYSAVIADSAERKSAVQRAILHPIYEVEKELASRDRTGRIAATTRKKIATAKAKQLERAAAKAAGTDGIDPKEMDDLIAKAIEAAAMAEIIEVPPIPRIIGDDATPEAVVSRMSEQGGQFSIISTEGGIFDIMTGRYSNKMNIDVFLKAHSGDKIKVDRQGRPDQVVDSPALTMGLMIQPTVLEALARQDGVRGRGLLARFLYARPVSKLGRREIGSPAVTEDVEKRYNDTIASLALGLWGSTVELLFSQEAEALMFRISEQVEPLLAPGGTLDELRDWGGKYAGAVARIAGILHLAKYGIRSEDGEDSWLIPVSVHTLEAALKIGEYFRASAVNAFAEMVVNRIAIDATYLLERIRYLGVDEVSEQEMHAKCQSRFPTKKQLKPVIEHLVDHGYLEPLPPAPPTGGRPKSPSYRICPAKDQESEGLES